MDEEIGTIVDWLRDARLSATASRREAMRLRSENERLQALLDAAEARLARSTHMPRPAPVAAVQMKDITISAEALLDHLEDCAAQVAAFLDTVNDMSLTTLPFSEH